MVYHVSKIWGVVHVCFMRAVVYILCDHVTALVASYIGKYPASHSFSSSLKMIPKTPPTRSRNGSPLHTAYTGASSYKPDNMSVANELHPVIHAGRVALITGGASGIGHAAALEFAK